jgi:DNA adenine methylase
MDDSFRHSYFESPLRYPGGKACLFPFISKLFYENNLVGTDYAEPYAGGAGLALKLLFNEYVNRIYINDYDYLIHCFWKSVLDSNGRFCDWMEDVTVSLDNWHYYKTIQNNPTKFSEFEVAQATFFLNRTNVSGVLKGGPIGGQKQTSKYKIDARFNKVDLIKRIERIGQFRSRIKLSNSDGLKFIKMLNKKPDGIFVYLDPPYVQKGAELYMNYYVKKDHERLARQVELIRHKWLVSYDNNEFILKLYDKNQKITYRLSQSASNRVGTEVLVFSNDTMYANAKHQLRDVVAV